MVTKKEFERIKKENPESRIWHRDWWEQEIRNALALVIKKQRKRAQKWKEKSKSLEMKETELRNKKFELEMANISKKLEYWNNLTLQDLKFLESLSFSDLSQITVYNIHWMSRITHKNQDDWWNTSSDHPHFPKYTFLYESFEDSRRVDEKIKSELKEKAKDEVWEFVCDEIEKNTSIKSWNSTIIKYILKYIPQKTLADKLKWTWNTWTNTNIDVLQRHIDLFTELDEDYKKEIEREYDREHGK